MTKISRHEFTKKDNPAYCKKSVGLTRKQVGLTPNPAQAGFYLRWQMASCILSSSKYFQYLKTLALAGSKMPPKSAFFS